MLLFVNSVVNPDPVSGLYYITAGITSGIADYGFWTRDVSELLKVIGES